MIKLTLNQVNSSLISFTVSGHSNFGKKGNNLLCAGVSTLIQTIIISFKKVLCINISLDVDDGFINCKFPANLTTAENDKVSLLMMTMICGMEDLKKQFPKEININWINNKQEAV
jgi:uncharacterized protein YsxB (DUF464 family)